MARPHVVIVGGGFAGISAARALRHAPVDVTLIDRHNYHLFTPLLFQVASALLDPSEVAHPERAVLRDLANVRFRLSTVGDVDLAKRVVHTDCGDVSYDQLILAGGSKTNYFGNGDLARSTMPLKSLGDGIALRDQVLRCFELSVCAPADRRSLLTFVIVGGGPTGVEYAGALSELVRLSLSKDFPELDASDVEIVLVHAGDRLLHPFAPGLGRGALLTLQRRGVRVRLGTRVEKVAGDVVHLSRGGTLRASTVVWAAGVVANDLASRVPGEKDHHGRVSVGPTLQLADHPDVFAVGDMAAIPGGKHALPELAAVATQSGACAGRNVAHLIAGEPLERFRYFDRGTMATIGRDAAVAQIGPIRLHGRVGWFAWLLVHLVLILSFRDRLMVLMSWAWAYLRYDRPVRIIAGTASRVAPARSLSPTSDRARHETHGARDEEHAATH